MFKNFQPYKNPLAQGCILPSISIDQRFYDELGLSNNVSNYEFLRRLCWKGIKEKGIDKLDNAQEYYARVKRELETFEELSFVDYILLNWEVHCFCIENNIPKGFSRGSCGGSLVLYLTHVTDVDPIKYNLFFERFVSKSRAKKIIGDDGITYLDGSLLADVDSDISYDRRQEVIKFIESKHTGRTSKILTVGTLSSKAVLRECGKIVEGLSEEDVNYISDNVPKAFNIPLDLKDALKESEKLRELKEQHPITFKIAKKLEGLIKNTGVHASGIAISAKTLQDVMPVQRTKEGELVSGLEMNDVAALAVKFDILGLKTLTVVADCCKHLGMTMKDFNPDDESQYWPLQNLIAPQGLFQIETDATYRICQNVRPRNLAQLAAVNALSRPGAMQFAGQYAKYVQTGEAQSLHPFLDDVFKDTGSLCIFQEQVLKALNKVGFDLETCETIRKIIGKKLVDKMPEWEQKLKDKVAENGIDPKVAEVLWKVMSDSANYQFAAVHSIAYSMLSFATIFLKFNHPQEFFLALLKMTKHEQDSFGEILKITQELPLFGMKLLPPDLSKSQKDFSIEGKDLRFGLLSVKGVSEKTIDNLLDFRGKESSNKYELFCNAKDSGMAINILCGLIQAGCLDSFGEDRPLTILEAQMFNALTPTERAALVECGEDHGYDVFAGLRDAAAGKIMNAKGKPVFSEKKLTKLREEHSKFKQIYDQNIKHHKFCNWYFERKLLGYSYSYNLREVFDEPKNSFTPVFEVSSLEDNDRVRIVGVVGKDVKKVKSKKTGETYLSLELSDETGRVRCLFMDTSKGRKFSEYVENGNILPKEENILVIVGKKNKDVIFVDSMEIMDERIALKLKDLKNQ